MMEMAQVLCTLDLGDEHETEDAYKKPKPKRAKSRNFLLLFIRNCRTDGTGMMNIAKSVAIFMLEVRYHIGSVYMHLPIILGRMRERGKHANPKINSWTTPQATMSMRNQKQIR
jgi:hypothetical protein